MAELDALQQRLGYHFQEVALLRLALAHPSVAHEAGADKQTNQRLEFLGDAVLGLVLARELHEKYPAFEEGPLTKSRAKLVNRHTLAAHARALALGDHLILGRGEDRHGGRERVSTLADAYEAVIGAIFLDGGFAAAGEVVLREFSRELGELADSPVIDNPKGDLQELLQTSSPESPQYHVVSATGPDHDREFECTVQHGGVELARGRGKSKREAESAAALAALQNLRQPK